MRVEISDHLYFVGGSHAQIVDNNGRRLSVEAKNDKNLCAIVKSVHKHIHNILENKTSIVSMAIILFCSYIIWLIGVELFLIGVMIRTT